MKQYPAYKDSGYDWIGKIPSGWSLGGFSKNIALRHGFQFRDSDFTESGIKIVKITQLDKNGYLNLSSCSFIDPNRIDSFKDIVIDANDILMCLTGGTIGKIIRVDNVGEILLQNYRVGHFSSLSANKMINDFIFWLMVSEVVQEQISYFIRTTGQPNIGKEDFSKMVINIPSYSEQLKIATFLDQKTRQIDDLIAKKQKLIELLKKERTALIFQAVTKGLVPTVPMKDSGIEWLGEIPEKWELKKVKQVLQNFDNVRIPLSSEERGKMASRTYDYYGASGVIDKVENYLFDGEYILIGEDGANILTRSSSMAYKAAGKFWVNNHAHILKPIEGNIDFFVYVMEQIDYSLYASGSAQPKLTQDKLGNITIPIPPIKEQKTISEYIEKRCSEIESIISRALLSFELLQEYKTSLINEAVTGKIDVRDYQISHA